MADALISCDTLSNLLGRDYRRQEKGSEALRRRRDASEPPRFQSGGLEMQRSLKGEV
jgi:hypothetical protein